MGRRGHRRYHVAPSAAQMPSRTISASVFGTIIVLLTAAYLLVLYLIHMNYLDELIGSFIYVILTVSALAFLPGLLTKILCSVGLSVALTYLIYVLNPTLFAAICVFLVLALFLFIYFVTTSVKMVGRDGLRGLALGFGIGVGGVAGAHVAHKVLRRRRRRHHH